MFGENLRSARIRAGLSLRDLEQAVGKAVSAQAIGKYERGGMRPSEKNVNALAQALRISKEALYMRHTIEIGKIDFRENSVKHRVDEKQIRASIHDKLVRYIEVEKLLGVSTFDWDKPRQFPFPIRVLSDAELAAHRLRDAWQLGSDLLPNLSEFLEERGFKILLSELPTSVAGIACFVHIHNDQKFPVIVTNFSNTGERLRFTVIHEMAHILLENSGHELDFEKVCNRFAGAFLMPERFLWDSLGRSRSNISIGELVSLKKFLGVSVQAIVYRCKELGIISEYTYRSLYKEMSSRGWLKPPYAEPSPIDPEEPQRFKRLCLRALAEGMISKQKAIELLAIQERDLNVLFDSLSDSALH